MLFRNLIIYSFTSPITLDADTLEQAITAQRFQPCSSQEAERLGWVAPLPQGDTLVHANQGFYLLKARKQEKILPGQVVNELLQERMDDFEAKQSRRPTRKEKQELKDQITLELLPKAFSRHQHFWICLNPQRGWLVVDASSHAKAEPLLNLLREALGSLPVIPPRVEKSPAAIMTAWLTDPSQQPNDLVLAQECELRAPEEDGGILRWRRQALEGEELESHLSAGKQAVRLGVHWQDSLSFTLCEDLTLKRLQASERLQDELANDQSDNAQQEFDALFTLSALELARLLPAWISWFEGNLGTEH